MKSNSTPCVPVALFIFNRLNETSKVLERIRQLKPKILLVIADGPRANHPTDTINCAAVRQLIKNKVDWPVQLTTNYSENNLGCKKRMATGIDWIFENHERAIILEDDCVPDVTFFQFCEELLEFYATNHEVGMISGNNFTPINYYQGIESYYFSRFTHIWGWATWRRAWKLYDFKMQEWPKYREKQWLTAFFPEKKHKEYWNQIFDKTHSGKLNAWDYQWLFTAWKNNFLTIIPSRNLVSNVGFGSDATNTSGFIPNVHGISNEPIPFPLRHPPKIERNMELDNWTQINYFGCAKDNSCLGRLKRLKQKIFRHLSK